MALGAEPGRGGCRVKPPASAGSDPHSKELQGAASDGPAPAGAPGPRTEPRPRGLLAAATGGPARGLRPQGSDPGRGALAPAASAAPSDLTAACGVRCRSTLKASCTPGSRCLGGSGLLLGPGGRSAVSLQTAGPQQAPAHRAFPLVFNRHCHR